MMANEAIVDVVSVTIQTSVYRPETLFLREQHIDGTGADSVAFEVAVNCAGGIVARVDADAEPWFVITPRALADWLFAARDAHAAAQRDEAADQARETTHAE